MTRFATCAYAFVALLLAVPSDAQDAMPAALETVTRTLDAETRQRNLPSLSVAIVRDGKIVYRRAFGHVDLEGRVAATPDTVYPVGSITKVFVATMLMQLVERGVVRLDDPLSKYVPEYRPRSPFPGTRPTTLRQLASHSSGLPRDAGVNFWMNYTMAGWMLSAGGVPLRWYVSKEELLSSLEEMELEYPPNSRAVYSNLGMSLLAIALERASGQPFADYLAQRILRPLGMTNSGLLDAQQQARLPTGYVFVGSSPTPLVAPPWQLGAAMYTGGLTGTAEDMARFVSLQFQERATDGSQILSGDSLREMRAPAAVGGAGLGWWSDEIEGHRFFEHSGGHLGYMATMGGLPDLKIGVVVMTNSFNPIWGGQPTTDLARTIYRILIPAVRPVTATAFDATKVDLARYAGTYAVPGGDARIRLELVEGALRFSVIGSPAPQQVAYPVGADSFSLDGPNGSPSLLFDADGRGAIEAVTFALFRFKRAESTMP